MPGEPCWPGLRYCYYGECGGVCRRYARQSEACDHSFKGDLTAPCAYDLYRTGLDSAGGTGTCTETPLAIGQPCHSDYECDRANGVICFFRAATPDRRACERRPGLNQSCDYAWQCDESLQCAGDDTCRPRVGPGEPCGDNACRAELYCDTAGANYVCRERKADGEACQGFTECQGSRCVDGKCRSVCAPD